MTSLSVLLLGHDEESEWHGLRRVRPQAVRVVPVDGFEGVGHRTLGRRVGLFQIPKGGSNSLSNRVGEDTFKMYQRYNTKIH